MFILLNFTLIPKEFYASNTLNTTYTPLFPFNNLQVKIAQCEVDSHFIRKLDILPLSPFLSVGVGQWLYQNKHCSPDLLNNGQLHYSGKTYQNLPQLRERTPRSSVLTRIFILSLIKIFLVELNLVWEWILEWSKLRTFSAWRPAIVAKAIKYKIKPDTPLRRYTWLLWPIMLIRIVIVIFS